MQIVHDDFLAIFHNVVNNRPTYFELYLSSKVVKSMFRIIYN